MKRRPRPFGRRSLATTVDPLPMNAKPYTRWNIGKKCPFQKNATSSSFKSWPSPFHSFLFPSHRCCVTNELIYARFFFFSFSFFLCSAGCRHSPAREKISCITRDIAARQSQLCPFLPYRKSPATHTSVRFKRVYK